tara:strand:+ start:1437 stop:2312 length:876 start_codon:yes stop_codon:yes gene_type:complete
MKAFIFPGQGSQFSGMGSELYNSSEKAKKLFELSNSILGFDICKIMFEGSDDELKKTNVTQPAIFIHSTILSSCMNVSFDMVAGHSLGEFSALVAAQAISFEDGLKLVIKRAEAMQKACQTCDSTMAAIIGLNAEIIEEYCQNSEGVVVPANYNAKTQIVISGERKTLEKTCQELSNLGAKKTIILPVGGAFHSPVMNPAKKSLKIAIDNTEFKKPICPIYQNVSAHPSMNQEKIKFNLIEQLTAPVKWYQTIEQMIKDGALKFIEIGPKNVLTGLNRRINRDIESIKGSL